jgi:predicted homoserine dehydrogenase-like protein
VIILDRELERLEREGRPIRVAMVGAGFMGRGIARQLLTATTGIRLVAIANRHPERAREAFAAAGVETTADVDDPDALEQAVASGVAAVTDQPELLCRGPVDVVVEVTGTVDFAAGVALEAIAHGKHVVLMNAEVDGTIGPLLKRRADEAGVVITNADGDQPGVTMNVYRFVRGLGVRPVLCGNIKGLHDPYRNPTTQAEFARRWGQDAHMVTSFADGSKISFEQAVIANATGMRVLRRGMLGLTVEAGTPVREAAGLFPAEELLEGAGAVDYVVGAEPAPGVFVLGTHDDPVQQHYLDLYKLGAGPLYCFYSPYHLCHFEVPNTIARAALFGDATIAPAHGPVVEVVAGAKVDLEQGQELDRIGGYLTYGLAENSTIARAENLLPLGLAEGARMLRKIDRDAVLTLDDVELPEGRLAERLWREQLEFFAAAQAAGS